MRRAAKRDANESALWSLAERLGAAIFPGPPLDGWCVHRGVWTVVEVKNPDGRNKLTESQIKFLARCEAERAPVFIWRTEDDVLRCLNGA